MISKITWGSDFGGLVDYLTEHRNHEVLDLRGVSIIEMAAEEMAMVASLSARAKSVVCHMSFSVAHEDGRLASDTWIAHVDFVDDEFQLHDHQRVIVRHSDKQHDHIHVFYCTVSPETCRTPPNQWFLAKGAIDASAGALALSAEQVAAASVDQRVRGSWNRRALIRLQQLCRAAEKRLGLRQLRSPGEIAAARERGEKRAPLPDVARRAERTGAISLLDRGDEIRDALDQPDWPRAQAALARHGIGIEPSFRARKGGASVISGLLVFELSDRENRVPASQFDVPGQKYGLRQIEKRHEPGARTIDEWWPVREPEVPTATVIEVSEDASLRQEFQARCAKHRLLEAEKLIARQKLAAAHKRASERLRRQLAKRRKRVAARLPVGERRAFYKHFSLTLRHRAIRMLEQRHRLERELLKRSRMSTWPQFREAQRKREKRPTMVGDWTYVPVTQVADTAVTIERFLDRAAKQRARDQRELSRPTDRSAEKDDRLTTIDGRDRKGLSR